MQPQSRLLFSMGTIAMLLFSSFQSVPFHDCYPIEEAVTTSLPPMLEIEYAEKIELFLKRTVPGLDLTYRDVFDLIMREGYNIRITGGAIRDLLAQGPCAPADIDFNFDCTIDEMKNILNKNGIPFTAFDHRRFILIGSQDQIRMEGVESRRAFDDEAKLDFTVNTIYYHVNTATFELHYKKGLKDLKDKRLLACSKDLSIWLYEGQSGYHTKIFRFWKMRGKGYKSPAYLERFVIAEAIEAFKRDPEFFRGDMLYYLGHHFSAFEDVRRGCLLTMGAKWCTENIDSLYIEAKTIDSAYVQTLSHHNSSLGSASR